MYICKCDKEQIKELNNIKKYMIKFSDLRWFSPGTPFSPRHDNTEIML